MNDCIFNNSMDHFELSSNNKPAGDQPKAIESLVSGLQKGLKHQTLLGVTGSGKSVVTSTPVLIKDWEGVRMMPIGELIEKTLRYYSEMVVRAGETDILDTEDLEIFTWSFDPKTGKAGWKKNNSIYTTRS